MHIEKGFIICCLVKHCRIRLCRAPDEVPGFAWRSIRPDSWMSVPGLQGSPDAFNHKESVFRTVTILENWKERARGGLRIFRKELKIITKVLKTQKQALYQNCLINTCKIEAGRPHKIKQFWGWGVEMGVPIDRGLTLYKKHIHFILS